MRTLVKNGRICDGTGAPVRPADLLLEDGRIAAVEPAGSLDCVSAEVLDASGKLVTPGFIDSHRHADFAALTDPDFGEAELSQGITTMLVGNCGMSAAPATELSRREWYPYIEPCLGKPPAEQEFSDFDSYLRALEEHGAALETGALVGIGSVKCAVKGFAETPWTDGEMELAQDYLCRALEAGAFGMTCGIMYQPECYSTMEEYVRLLRPTARYGRPLCCHMRSEGDRLPDAVDEVIRITAEAGLPLNISHFKVFGRQNWGCTLPRVIEKIERARSAGQDITVDFYPYTGGATTLMTLIPPVCLRGSTRQTLDWLSTPEGVDTLRRELRRDQPGWDNMVFSIGWDRVLISSVQREENRRFQGLSIPRACELAGDEDETAFMVRLLCEEQGKVGIIVMSMDPADVDLVAKLPYAGVISDALYGAPDFPHPRLYGAFPRVLRDMVRERGVLTLEEAVHKMTGLTARRFGMTDRGELLPGKRADLNILDPDTVCDCADFLHPKRTAKGLQRVMIAGQTVWLDEKRTQQRPAHVMRAGL